MKKAYLYLENGQVLEGRSFGAVGTAMGELVFTTGMTGRVESLTDPSYYGRLVVYTFPQFGNYGICRADQESPHCQMGGVVVRGRPVRIPPTSDARRRWTPSSRRRTW